jgi:hypothetical protein
MFLHLQGVFRTWWDIAAVILVKHQQQQPQPQAPSPCLCPSLYFLFTQGNEPGDISRPFAADILLCLPDTGGYCFL